jgi:hypothetical protein
MANGKCAVLRAKFGEACTLQAYHCPYCGAYHLGHPKWTKEEIEAVEREADYLEEVLGWT